MLRKLLAAASALLIIALVAGGLWYYRPWSDFSPAKIASLSEPENLPVSFRSMANFFPSRVVHSGDTRSPLPSATAPLTLQYGFAGEEKSLERFLEESGTTGLLVLKDGVIVHERYRLGADRESLFTSWSVAKSFVATVVMMALKEGRIDSLDDPVVKYAPQFAGSGFADVSLANLLIMSSGVDFNEDYNADDSDIRPYFFDTFILGRNADELLRPFQRNRPPGSTGNTSLSTRRAGW